MIQNSNLKIIIYQIYSFNQTNYRYNYHIIKPTSDILFYDENNHMFRLKNLFGTTQLKLKYTTIIDEKISHINSVDITPSFIYFKDTDVITLANLQNKKLMYERELNEIISEQFQPNISVERYYELNDLNENISNKINLLETQESEIDIKTIEIYNPTQYSIKKYIQYNYSKHGIIWEGYDEDEQCFNIKIEHELNGYVNCLIDFNDISSIISYKIYFVSNNFIRIKLFCEKTQIINLFSITLFKIADIGEIQE